MMVFSNNNPNRIFTLAKFLSAQDKEVINMAILLVTSSSVFSSNISAYRSLMDRERQQERFIQLNDWLLNTIATMLGDELRRANYPITDRQFHLAMSEIVIEESLSDRHPTGYIKDLF